MHGLTMSVVEEEWEYGREGECTTITTAAADVFMVGWINGWLDEFMYGWTDGWMSEWISG